MNNFFNKLLFQYLMSGVNKKTIKKSYDYLSKIDTSKMSDDELKNYEIKLFDAFIKSFPLRF